MRKWAVILLWCAACGEASDGGGATGAPAAGDDPIQQQLAEAQIKKATALCKGYYDIAQMVRMQEGLPPSSLDDVEGLRLELDPWGGEFRLERDGKQLWIVCDGPDGRPGTADDVRWPKE